MKLYSFEGTSERFLNLSAVILNIPSSIKFMGMFDSAYFSVLSRTWSPEIGSYWERYLCLFSIRCECGNLHGHPTRG